MEDAGAEDQIEGQRQAVDALDRQLMELEVVEVVSVFELAGVPQAGVTDVDGHDPCRRVPTRVSGRLRRAAASDQDGLLVRQRPVGPGEMELRPAPAGLERLVLVEVRNRRRIGQPFVEVANLVSLAHGNLVLAP